MDEAGNLYISDSENRRIRMVDASGNISTVAGKAPVLGIAEMRKEDVDATTATLYLPYGLAIGGGRILFSERSTSHRIRMLSGDMPRQLSTYAGVVPIRSSAGSYNGDGGSAVLAGGDPATDPTVPNLFNSPQGIALDGAGNLFIVDANNHRIRRVDAATGQLDTVVGTGANGFSGDGGAPLSAQIHYPRAVTVDLRNGDLYIADSGNHRIRKVTGLAQPFTPPPPPPPPVPNRPPVANEAFDDGLNLNPDQRTEVSLRGKFRDPDGGALFHSARSMNPEVATAAVEQGRLWVRGVSPGLAMIEVTARDSGGLAAKQSFRVTVGRVLTFTAPWAAAPEGESASLQVQLTQRSERPIPVQYEFGADESEDTADADPFTDLEQGRGTEKTIWFAPGETEAAIEIPFQQDTDIEPAREHLRVYLMEPPADADWALGQAEADAIIQEGVCDRTPAVRDGLRGTRECWAPSVADLAGTGYLNLSRQGIASLRERDFLGLAGLRVLHLHGNRLAELPGGLFAGLESLERLRLDGNRLAMLQEDLFDGLDLLSSLDLGGNRIASPPGGLLSGASSLSRLDLGGNRIRALPAGFFEGASSLNEVNLADNPGAPFMLTMELVRTDAALHADGPATLNSRVREGAPFALTAGVMATNAGLSRDSVTIRTGDAECSPMQVTLAEGGAAWVRLTEAPAVPDAMCGEVDKGRRPCYQGLTTAAGDELLLFKRAPWVVQAVPGQGAESLGGALELDLAGLFAADRDDALSYRAESSDPALASVRVSGGVLSIEPNDEGLTGLVTVRLTATDSDGLAVQQSFRVEVSPPPRQFGSGWRLGWLTDAPAPSAEAAPAGGEPR